MHWPLRRPQASREEEAAPAAPSDASDAPKPADGPGLTSRFSAPPPVAEPPSGGAVPLPGKYDSMDFSKYSNSVYESDGLRDAQLARQERSGGGFNGYWIQNPRARQCVSNIQLGAKMGASVGGCFGLLTGLVVAVTQRNVLVLPVSVIGGAVSFGFFLGCGMIIRCEEGIHDEACGKTTCLAVQAAPLRTRPVDLALHRQPAFLRPRVAGLMPLARRDTE